MQRYAILANTIYIPIEIRFCIKAQGCCTPPSLSLFEAIQNLYCIIEVHSVVDKIFVVEAIHIT